MARSPLRALFFGSPAFAVPSLDALHSLAEIHGVVCQPDKPRGRGLELAAPAVKVRALELGLPVVQPTKLRTGEFGEWARAQNADVALVVAYGRTDERSSDVLPANERSGDHYPIDDVGDDPSAHACRIVAGPTLMADKKTVRPMST